MFLSPGMKMMAVPLFFSAVFWAGFFILADKETVSIQTLLNMCVAQGFLTLIFTLAIIKDDFRLDDPRHDGLPAFFTLSMIAYAPILILLYLFIFRFYFFSPKEKYSFNYFGYVSFLMLFFLDFVIATKKMNRMLQRMINNNS